MTRDPEMPKSKPKKGLLKRIRVTSSGRVKIGRSFGRHLRSHKSRKLLRSYRQPAFVKSCDAGRVSRMLFMRVTHETSVQEDVSVE